MAKILINSLLWYMNDRLSGLTAETIIKIVSDFYSPEEIVEAKTVLHNNYEGAGRLKLRQGDQNLSIILRIFIWCFWKCRITKNLPQF